MVVNRRKFLKTSGILGAFSFFPWDKILAGSFMDELPYQMNLIRNNTGIFTERGGTIAWHLSKDGIVIVDSQFPEQAGHLIDEIRKKSDQKIDALINTHHHGDHTAGNMAFKGLVNKLVAHRNSKINQENVAKQRNSEDQQLYPDTVFEKEWKHTIGNETITATYFGRAHTNGDAVIHFENANIAHVGDLVFNRRFPYIDLQAGASISNWIHVLEQIQKEYDNDTLFVFGHNREPYKVTGGKEDIKAMAHYLEKLLAYVSQGIKQGKTLEQIATVEVIPGAEEWQGDGIMRSFQAAYEELTQ